MDLEVVKNFLKLCETLSFTKASKEVFIAQPALSRQIKKLEDDLGVQLFKRDKRNVALTIAGSHFRGEMEKVLIQVARISSKTKQIAKGLAGEISIGYTHSMAQTALPEIIARVNREFPELKTVLRELNNSFQYQALASQEIDIAFVTNPIVPRPFKSKVFREDNFVIVVPMNHPVTEENFKGVADFAGEQFILPPDMEGSDYVRVMESICLDAGFYPEIVHQTASVNTAFKLVEAGLGVTIEPKASLSGQNLSIRYLELKSIPQKALSVVLWNGRTEIEHLPVLNLVLSCLGL